MALELRFKRIERDRNVCTYYHFGLNIAVKVRQEFSHNEISIAHDGNTITPEQIEHLRSRFACLETLRLSVSIPMDLDITRISEALKVGVTHPFEDKKITLREYCGLMLKQLWQEGDCFSGKYPFGDSGWDHQIYYALIHQGFIEGTIDGDDYQLTEKQEKQANLFIGDVFKLAVTAGNK